VTPDPAARPPLDADRLAAADPDELPGLHVEVVDEAASTNALVAARGRTGAAQGLVVVAEHQTAGRGRLDRTWETPARSALTFSVLLRPTSPTHSWPWLPLLTGYAVAKALRGAGFEASVKWPNDVLLGPAEGPARKVAGILVERIETDGGPAAVVGIGINVGMTAEELPVPEATSLAVASAGDPPERTDLLVAVLQTLWEAYATWEAGEGLAGMRLAESYVAACTTVGRDVRVDLPSGAVLTGRATGVDPSGRLLVERDGVRTAVSAGDVVHVRAG
jgi:BirA family transcriptional regulator, biotin operon repressor / biotin---[acetyl-CoA-carboxylase] ligase